MVNSKQLLEIFEKTVAGFTLAELIKVHPENSRRTLQRWINQLIKKGKLMRIREGRSQRYYFAQRSQETRALGIPLSADSQDILTYIELPLTKRKPVGYQYDFLQSYQPNKTHYLSLPLRNQLRKMGDMGYKIVAGTYERFILERLLIDLSWASSNLEGNTYSLLDTRELIEHGQAAKGKAVIETQMILNHKAAIEFLANNIDTFKFNRYSYLNLHSVLAENLLGNPADEGRLRQHPVEIHKSIFRPLSIPQKIEEMFDLILYKANSIQDPFEQAFFLMVHIPYLQPFIDVNKRTSRLAANIPFFRHNLCPLTFLGVTEKVYTSAILGVYELTRVELLRDLFVWAYERSTQEYIVTKQEMVEPDPLRLKYRDLIKTIIHNTVIAADKDALTMINNQIKKNIDAKDRENLKALIIEELRRLHEGVLSRYRLRPIEFENWQKNQKQQNFNLKNSF